LFKQTRQGELKQEARGGPATFKSGAAHLALHLLSRVTKKT